MPSAAAMSAYFDTFGVTRIASQLAQLDNETFARRAAVSWLMPSSSRRVRIGLWLCSRAMKGNLVWVQSTLTFGYVNAVAEIFLEAKDGDGRLPVLLAAKRPSRTIPIDAQALRRLRERTLILTQGEMAERLGMSLSAYQNLESARTRSVYVRTLRRIADTAKIPYDDAFALLSPAWDENVEPYSKDQLPPVIPMFDLAVAAGRWVDVDETGQVCDPQQIDHGLFRVRIRGDSMTPRFKDGDVVEFRCLRDGRDALEVGAFYYVQKDHQATFKELVEIGEETLVLRAINRKKYPDPMPVERRSIVRMARAIAVVKLI